MSYSNLDILVKTGQKVFMKFKDRPKPDRYIVVSIPGRKLTLLINEAGGAWHTPKVTKSHYNHPLSVLLGEPPTKPITYYGTKYTVKHKYKVYKTNIGKKNPDPVIIYIQEKINE